MIGPLRQTQVAAEKAWNKRKGGIDLTYLEWMELKTKFEALYGRQIESDLLLKVVYQMLISQRPKEG